MNTYILLQTKGRPKQPFYGFWDSPVIFMLFLNNGKVVILIIGKLNTRPSGMSTRSPTVIPLS